jgi:hypothetical protein
MASRDGGARLLVDPGWRVRDGTPTRRPASAWSIAPPAERRAAFDVATFDRLRVLTTELRRLAAEAPTVELRLGPQARLSRRRLQAVLRWV